MVNTAAPPLPSLDRCVALGEALGEAVRASSGDRRVLVLASGGLSHWLPSNDPRDPAMDGNKRDTLINGRRDVRGFAKAREPKVRAMAGNADAPVNAKWDRWFLDLLGHDDPDLAAVTALGTDGLEREIGSGGQEVRSWLIGHAAVAVPFAWTSYEPVPEWITGMGIGTTFQVPDGIDE